jgi:hypothetical protein
VVSSRITTGRHNPEDLDLNLHRRENHKTRILSVAAYFGEAEGLWKMFILNSKHFLSESWNWQKEDIKIKAGGTAGPRK